MATRRRFIREGVFTACANAWAISAGIRAKAAGPHAASAVPILDTHIHLFDPTRPGGVPWPETGDLIYKPALPERYKQLAVPNGVVGAIAIEASPLDSDNDWLLNVVSGSTFMVGMIGDLDPTAPSFAPGLKRLQQNALFLGIRHGNLWNRSLPQDVTKPAFWSAIKQLQQAKLVLESANPDLPLLQALCKVVGRAPDLTIVVDHLPHMSEPSGRQQHKEFVTALTALAEAPRVFVKLSEIPALVNGRVSLDLGSYLARLDLLYGSFGPDKVLFGSDWPNSDHLATFSETLTLVKRYISSRSVQEQKKFFHSNSKVAYRWHAREKAQWASRSPGHQI